MKKVVAYQGNEPYIFISYSHNDREKVFPIIAKLQEKYNVWFDDGIHFGDDYKKTIIKHINESSLFIYMVSINSLTSSFCRREIKQAERKNIPFFNVIIEDCLDEEEAEEFMFDYEELQMCLLFKISIDQFLDDVERKAPIISKTVKKEKEIIIEKPIKTETQNDMFPTSGEPLVEFVRDNLEEIAKKSDNRQNIKNAEYLAKIISDCFKNELKITAAIATYDVGPSFTRFNILGSIDDRQVILDNLDLLKKETGIPTFRYVESIPGSFNLFGLEVINKDIVEIKYSDCYPMLPRANTNPFDVTLGIDVLYKNVNLSMEKAPNLFVLDDYGTCKDNLLKNIVTTLVGRTYPNLVKLILLDDGSLFDDFKNIPNLLGPIIKEEKDAFSLLAFVVDLINDRNALFEKEECLNIFEYNSSVIDKTQRIPYIFIVINNVSYFVKNKESKDYFIYALKHGYEFGIHFIFSNEEELDFISSDIKLSKVSYYDGFALPLAYHREAIIESNEINDGLPTRVEIPYALDKEIKEIIEPREKEFGLPKYDKDYLAYFSNLERKQKYSLEEKDNEDAVFMKKNHEKACSILNKIDDFFKENHILASCNRYSIGPSFTRFFISFNNLGSIKSLEKKIDDLSIYIGDRNIFFTSIVPNTPYSAIDVSNDIREDVNFLKMISKLDNSESHPLQIGFGLNEDYQVIKGDINLFPHMIICGTTGSGKSMLLHNIISTLILRNTPDKLRLVIFDPKKIEMTQYRDMPHLLTPIVNDIKDMNKVLDYLKDEMERRYEKFSEIGACNLNENIEIERNNSFFTNSYNIVLVIDEFADLVDADKNIVGKIIPLIQKARAAGIFVILATQRPTTNVITGVVKANMPMHVALMTANALDSFCILGSSGAEKLLGRGDMIIDHPLYKGQIRVQAPYIKVQDVKYIVNGLKDRYKTNYIFDYKEDIKDEKNIKNRPTDEHVKYIKEVVPWVETQEYVSVSKIQRELGFGFVRSNRYLDWLIEDNIIEVENTSKGHKVKI